MISNNQLNRGLLEHLESLIGAECRVNRIVGLLEYALQEITEILVVIYN
jgi:hypothetical protein